MRSFEIFLHPEAEISTPERRRPGGAQQARSLLDVFVRGANVTARVADGQAMSALVDVATATLHLASKHAGKRIVHFHDEACELCLERDGARAFLSVYRTQPTPEVYVYDRELPFAEITAGVRDSIARVLDAEGPGSGVVAKGGLANVLRSELATLRMRFDELAELPAPSDLGERDSDVETAHIEAPRDLPVAFAAELQLRARAQSSREAGLAEISDFHALLMPGKVSVDLGGRSVALGTLHPFLFCETLFTLSFRLFEAWQRGRAAHERIDAGGLVVGARTNGGALAVIFSTPAGTSTYPGLSLVDFTEGVLAFGSSLVRALLRRDRSQSKNLRLSAFRRRLRELRDALHEVVPADLKINGAPESYRVYAEHCTPKKGTERRAGKPPARLRYEAAWRAVVPGIDLASTFLCGNRIVVGGTKETYCLERDSGQVVWHRPTVRGASVVTPEGLVRIAGDGQLELHDWASGEVTLRAWSTPRAFGPPTGVVVSGPGLPRLLVMTEGERHLVAVDLRTGEARWRYAWAAKNTRGPAASTSSSVVRLRRHGKLLYVTSGDGALTAVDVVSGQIVWRVRDHLRFFVAPTVVQNEAFALAGGQAGKARVHSIDPYSGESRWSAELSGQYPTTEGKVLCGRDAVMVLRRERSGLHVEAFDRKTGERTWQTGVVAPTGSAWLVVDERLIGNTPGGELVGISTETGKTVYRTRLGRLIESDVPRRLEPVLRSGALFVPHSDVHVVRPEDGAVIGGLGCKEVIPDMLRVDERCSVYVAEEIGHLAAYEARAAVAGAVVERRCRVRRLRAGSVKLHTVAERRVGRRRHPAHTRQVVQQAVKDVHVAGLGSRLRRACKAHQRRSAKRRVLNPRLRPGRRIGEPTGIAVVDGARGRVQAVEQAVLHVAARSEQQARGRHAVAATFVTPALGADQHVDVPFRGHDLRQQVEADR